MSKRFLLVLVLVVVGFGGLLIFNKREEGGTGGGGGNQKAALTEHKEEGSSGVVLIEYGDFQCPACGQFYPVIKQLKQEYAGKVTFQFRHYPLTEIHNNALISARAAEAAAMQGKFFEMHDLLYENQTAWSQNTSPGSIFEGYAKQLGIDVNRFKEDIKSEKTNDSVQADRAYAREQEYGSTPTFVLDGKKIDNPSSYEDFKKLLDAAIAAKQNS